jgi:Uma2 family endonuclease
MTFGGAALLDSDDYPGEVVNGEWEPLSRNTWLHALIVGNAYALLRHYAKASEGWLAAVGDPGTKLTHMPDTVRGPDAAIIRADRLPVGKGAEGWLDGGPDLAVDVVGDRQTATQVARKAMEYIRAGSRMVWVIDPGPELVMIITAESQLRIIGKDDVLEGGDVLPGFSCKVSELFE